MCVCALIFVDTEAHTWHYQKIRAITNKFKAKVSKNLKKKKKLDYREYFPNLRLVSIQKNMLT